MDRFWSKIKRGGPDECWEWQAHINKDGYGMISVDGVVERSHRMSWKLTNGDIPKVMCILHSCDNPRCCNPSHLFLGTQKDNVADMVSKNRHRGSPGIKNPSAKLTEDEVGQIRRLRNETPLTLHEIGEMYDVSFSLVSQICKRKAWNHIP